jgi:L-iditol 2-dehydrogenase
MKTMKAAVYEGIEKIAVRDVPAPVCEDDGILVRVEACGICGGDVRNYHNGLKDNIQRQIMGHEVGGVVTEVGKKVTRFRVGDVVATAPDVSCGECYYCKRGYVNLCVGHRMLGTHWPGGFAQYLYLPSPVLERGFVERVPEGMSYEHAAFAEKASAVIACQEYNNVSLGDTVVIIGDGPVGCLHVEIARARGASRIIVVGLEKLAFVEQFKPDLLLSNTDPAGVMREVLEITEGIGADIVLCAVPSIRPQQQALEMTRKRGRMVIYGGVPKSSEMTLLNSNLIHYNEITVTGAFSYPATGLQKALKYIKENRISVDKYITLRVGLDGLVDGMKAIEQGRALNVMVKPWE